MKRWSSIPPAGWAGILALGVILLSGYLGRDKANKKDVLPAQVDYNFDVRPILSDRCYACHGPDEKKREAGLRLDTPEGAFAALGENKDHFAIVPGHPEKSALLDRINQTDPEELMPPPSTHLSLSDYEKALLRRWIEQGATYAPHWAFVVPVKSPLPKVNNPAWCNNEIDYFTLDKMTAMGLQPAKPADKARLLRRVCFDITGLPPSDAQRAQFLNDPAPDAYERLVDTLLQSVAFGERMAMNWLDLARYSDTHGYQDDLPRIMWPWRDWVVKAFNENIPYNQFVSWQLAGDLLPNATKEQILATGFNRNHKITQEGGVIDEEYRTEYVADRTNTFGKAFMGLTMECARCHDHKFDPITTKEYYSLFAFFNNVPESGFVPNLQTPKPWMALTKSDLEGKLHFLQADSLLKTDKDTLQLMVMQQNPPDKQRVTRLLSRGQYDQPTDTLQPITPSHVLSWQEGSPANRLGLSQWLFDAKNPLTARVTVNRIWQEIFGRGIVSTPENFGMQGALPTHPALLDWLAVDFQEHGWDLKRLIRQMVFSATYQQSAEDSRASREADPENIWLSRGPHYRMPYEFIRDMVLSTSGLLNPAMGGPSVKPYQPPGIWEEISTEKTANAFRGEFTYVEDTLPERMYRRSLYTYNKRTIPPPTHLSFDAPMRDLCEVRRSATSTPLQALVMLNDQQVLEAARVLAFRLLQRQDLQKPEKQIEAAFLGIAGRTARKEELRQLLDFYKAEAQRFQDNPASALDLLRASGPFPQSDYSHPAQQAALMLTVQIMYNLDEVISKT
ncbi:MAG: PSD1 domain-containing protein [Lewinellaceae bacterium]|nr:PSD1 domain-containing protein [Lewinellaceae bacterium]